MSVDPKALRKGRHLLLVHGGAMLIIFFAIAMVVTQHATAAFVLIAIVLIAVIVSLETLRVLLLSTREPRP